jgi:succinate dehydrogenase / fumarate reductase flavoprotein subunit
MRALMTSHVGLFRIESNLRVAKERLGEYKNRLRNVGIAQRGLAFNHELVRYLDLEGMLHLAEVVVDGALARKESRGSHFRLDYPDRDDDHWLRHTMAYKTPDRFTLDHKDVVITAHPPMERTY